MHNSTKRFSTRVENYVKYRPDYPSELFACLKDECNLNRNSVVADIGSGTGILTRHFLEHGHPVFAVEPNAPMREAAENLLGTFNNLTSINGTAEKTNLPDSSVDLIVVAQAFHWFDQANTKQEFTRILKPGGFVALVWNDRDTHSTALLRNYEKLLHDFATDYDKVDHKRISLEMLATFFEPHHFETREFANSQNFDFEGLSGRLHSSSYSPEKDHPNYEPMMEELKGIFDQHNVNGSVQFLYQTTVHFGQLG